MRTRAAIVIYTGLSRRRELGPYTRYVRACRPNAQAGQARLMGKGARCGANHSLRGGRENSRRTQW
eukprot:736420-Pyramimonas_sp.AAC.1